MGITCMLVVQNLSDRDLRLECYPRDGGGIDAGHLQVMPISYAIPSSIIMPDGIGGGHQPSRWLLVYNETLIYFQHS